jgi:CubicO group peptidase (beta-lactamase class C family)
VDPHNVATIVPPRNLHEAAPLLQRITMLNIPSPDSDLVAVSSCRLRQVAVCIVMAGLLIGTNVACSVGEVEEKALIRELDARIPEVISLGNSPSLQVAVVSGDRVIWSKGFGEFPSVEQIYMNASVQKVFSAIAILQLAERGLIELDTDIGTYIPFEVRHPGFPDTPITARMLLVHHSGLGELPHQFGWDTRSAFSPDYRPPCPPGLLGMSLAEYLSASLTPGGANYDEGVWRFEPDSGFFYSVSAYPLLRYVVEKVAGQSYPDYMRENVLAPLGMTNSGFSIAPFADRHAIPHTRIDGQNIQLPLWNGNGYMMRTTAEDQARLIIALMSAGRIGEERVLRPETVELMRSRTSRFITLFNRSGGDMQAAGHGLGLYQFRGGWSGFGGSAPGFQSLWRFHLDKQVGYVIMSNVNAILSGGREYDSARRDLYTVQDELLSILDPALVLRWRKWELAIVGVIILSMFVAIGTYLRRRRVGSRGA